MAEANTVVIRGRDAERYDGVADGSVTPGMLVEITGTTNTDRTFAAHATAGERAAPDFALAGKAGRSIDQAYGDGEYLEHKNFLPGDEVNALIAVGASVALGDLLESAGDGTLQTVDATAPDQAVAKATEAVDNTGGSDVARVIAKVI